MSILAILVSLIALSEIPSEASHDASEPDWDAPAVAYLQDTYDVSEAEARERLNRQESIGDLAETAAQDYPDSFAGLWVAHNSNGQVVVGFTENAEIRAMDAAAKSGFADVDAISPRQVRHSFADLRRGQKALTNALRNRSDLPDVVSVDVDVENNRLVAGLEQPTSEKERRLEDESAGVPVKAMAESAPVEDLACTSREWCSQPLRGGVKIYGYSYPEQCTSGFTATRDIHYLYVTAGHCIVSVGDYWYQDDNNGTKKRIGPVWDRQESGSVDAAVIHVDGTDLWDIEPIVYHTDSAQALMMNHVGGPNDAYEGRVLCSAGWREDLYCGEILKVFSDVDGYTDLMKTGICRSGGDSGAPVYDINDGDGIAFGIHSRSELDDPCPNGESAWHTYVYKADDALNFQLNTG